MVHIQEIVETGLNKKLRENSSQISIPKRFKFRERGSQDQGILDLLYLSEISDLSVFCMLRIWPISR